MKLTIKDPPERGSADELQDLSQVVEQYQDRFVPDNLQQRCDEDMEGMMFEYLANRGASIDLAKLNEIRKAAIPIIYQLKNYFNRPRPAEVAASYDIPFFGDYLESAQTPSYPSGHTVQAYVCAGYCAQKYPEHSEGLYMIANLVSQSRIDRGVHFPSDVEYGIEIAAEIISQLFGGQ